MTSAGPSVLPFMVFLLVLLLSRLALIQRERPLTRPQALGFAALQCSALLAAAPNPALLGLVMVIVLVNLGGAWLERRRPLRLVGYRLGVLLMILLAAGFAFAPTQGVATNPLLLAAGDWLGQNLLYVAPSTPAAASGSAGLQAVVVLMGALVVLNEVNLLIRGILQLIRVVPRTRGVGDAGSRPDADAGASPLILPPVRPGEAPQQLDVEEYNAGRYIGLLERLLVYTFVLQGQHTAIAVVIAAKGFARFKDMDQRDFAEYVVIGTLLSVAGAVLVAEAVKLLLA